MRLRTSRQPQTQSTSFGLDTAFTSGIQQQESFALIYLHKAIWESEGEYKRYFVYKHMDVCTIIKTNTTRFYGLNFLFRAPGLEVQIKIKFLNIKVSPLLLMTTSYKE